MILALQNTLLFALLAILALACWSDLRARRIPNLYTGSGVAVALLLRATMGPGALLEGFLGAGLMFVAGLLLLMSSGFGGGDAKLLVVVGALVGISGVGSLVVAVAVLGMLLCAGYAWMKGALAYMLHSAWHFLVYLVTLGRRGSRPAVHDSNPLAVPYALPIALGAVLTFFS